MIRMIVAAGADIAGNFVIGNNNSLPWKIAAELRWFRMNTIGKTLVMGRKTYESLPVRPLPDRTTVVMTSSLLFPDPAVQIIHSPEEVLGKDIIVCGGASVYKQFLPYTDELFFTEILGTFEGDTYFPLRREELARDFRVAMDMPVKTEGVHSWKHFLYHKK